ncbi:MAG: PaaI family thioesterase [Gammaproteobacteria bacterium]|nr:PaaI family thioesterase [Gammaproteobacteria bacterium]
MTDDRIRSDANNCFVCGPSNPIGLQLEFHMDQGICRASFCPGEHHIGFADMTHGGLIYCALDDVMANWLFLQGARGHTAKCEIRYRQPVSVGTQIELEGRMVKRKGPLAMLEGTATRAADHEVIADAKASFMIVDPGNLADV